MSQPPDSSTHTPPAFPSSPVSAPRLSRGRFNFLTVLSRWWLLAVLVIMTALLVAAMLPTWLKMRGPLYESTALLEARPLGGITGSHGSGMITRQFMTTQFEIIEAPETLSLALEKGNLLINLGGDRAAAMNRMRKSIRTKQKRGTDLIEISYRDEDPELANDACTAIYEAYRDRRNDFEMSNRRRHLAAIKVELQNKSDHVAELRKRLMDAATKAGFIMEETEHDSLKTESNRHVIEKMLYQSENKKDQLEHHLKKLHNLRMLDFIRAASVIPDLGFEEDYKKLQKLRDQQQTKNADDLAKTLLVQAEDVRKTLQLQVTLLENSIIDLRKERNRYQDMGTLRPQYNIEVLRRFNTARKDYQTAQQIKDQLQLKYDIEKTKLAIPPRNTIVHQTPVVSNRPVTQGKNFAAIMGTVVAIPISFIGAILLMYLAEAIFPRRD